MPGQPIRGKSAIVTGAGSGINLEFARLLLQGGANVLFADLSLRPEAKELVEQYSGPEHEHPRAVFQKTNVTDWKQLELMFQVADQEFGEVDIVCPGAGVYEPPFSNFWLPPGSPESWDDPASGRYALLDINLTHPIRATQLAISHFVSRQDVSERKPKYIIHISSIAGQKRNFTAPIYVATKHAINGFVRSLAGLEDELGIRVAAVAPGVIKTPLWTEHPEKMKVINADDEWVLPEEVADAMLALIEKDNVAEKKDGSGSIVIKGGTILEVSKGRVRDVKEFDDPGPGSVAGNTTGSTYKLVQDIWEYLKRPGWGKC